MDDSDAKPSSENLQHYLVENSEEPADSERYPERSGKIFVKSPLHIYEEEEHLEYDKEWELPTKHRRPHDLSIQTLDEMDTFFLSMSKTLKKLPKLDQIKVRTEIYEVVTQAEVQWLQKSDTTGSD